MTEIELRKLYVAEFQKLVGKCAEGSENHKALLATYNTLAPLPRGVKMMPAYDWCACTVTALALRCGLDGIFAKECSCTKQIEQWQHMGTWMENDAYVPSPGDIIYFAWDASGTGDWVSDVDHVGVVEKCDTGYIYTIEGNKGNNVSRRTIPVNYRYIRGFAVPDYKGMADMEENDMTEKEVRAIVKEMLRGEKTDVPDWAADEMAEAVELGITDGSRPLGYATRNEVALMVKRAVKGEKPLAHIWQYFIGKIREAFDGEGK